MTMGRVLGGVLASAVVAGGFAVAVGMSRSAYRPAGDAGASGAFTPPAVVTVHPSYAPLPSVAAPARPRSSSVAVPSRTAAPVLSSARPSPAAVLTTSAAARPASPTPAPSHTSAAPAPTHATSAARPAPRAAAAQRGGTLPLRYYTGSATRVITVTAYHRSSTTARLQAWRKAPGGGWLQYGTAVTAHIGADGMSTQPSESRSATPIGSFTLTQAFGYYANPGTSLPYFKTRPSDWWISQAGPLYNTHQRCSSGCRFTRGAPNEHLYYETPFYDYAVVIDYNTRNAPGGVRQGAGSAFFLHVTDGSATAGCVAIPQSRLVPLLRWLTPAAHPRILIGTI